MDRANTPRGVNVVYTSDRVDVVRCVLLLGARRRAGCRRGLLRIDGPELVRG